MSYFLIAGFGLTFIYCAGWLFLYSARQQWEDYMNLTKDEVFGAHLGYFFLTFLGLMLIQVKEIYWNVIFATLFLLTGFESVVYALRIMGLNYRNIIAGDVMLANLIGGGCLCKGVFLVMRIYGV
jgi:hypothetical protein